MNLDAAPVLIQAGWHNILRYFSLLRASMVVKKREGARVVFWNRPKSTIKAGRGIRDKEGDREGCCWRLEDGQGRREFQ